MFQLLDYAKSFIRDTVPADGVVADFTAGNGHDTEFLCRLVPDGKVYAFDIQSEAIERTRKHLGECGLSNAVLINDSHAEMDRYISEPIDAGMFNLGWLPGSDKSVHTLLESTLTAVGKAVGLLRNGAVLVISVYPGHEEGTREGEELMKMLATLDRKKFCVACLRLINSPDAPFVITIEKYNK